MEDKASKLERSLGATVVQGVAAGLSAGVGTVAAQKVLDKLSSDKPKTEPPKK
jgi:formate/nitrite transporter FocA (FNT family)